MRYLNLSNIEGPILLHNTVKAGNNVPSSRSFHSCQIYESQMYLFGGTAPLVTNDLWILDLGYLSVLFLFSSIRYFCLASTNHFRSCTK